MYRSRRDRWQCGHTVQTLLEQEENTQARNHRKGRNKRTWGNEMIILSRRRIGQPVVLGNEKGFGLPVDVP